MIRFYFKKIYKAVILFYALLFLMLSITINNAKSEDLIEILNLAFANSYEYQASVEDYNASQVNKDIGMSYLFPTVDIGATASFSRINRDFENNNNDVKTKEYPYGVYAEFLQPIVNFQIFKAYSKLKMISEKGRLELDISKNKIIVTVITYYLDVLHAKEDVEYIKTQKKYLEEQMQEVTQRIKVGDVRRIDIEEVKSNYEAVKYQEIILNNNLSVKIDQLNKFLNRTLINYKTVKEDIYAIEVTKDPLEYWLEVVTGKNLDILLAKYNVSLLNYDIALQQANHYPSLSLKGRYAYTESDNKLGTAGKYTNSDASIGLSLNMNVYSGGKINNTKKQLGYQLSSQNLKLKQLEYQYQNLAMSYYNSVNSGISQIDSLKQSAIAAQKFLMAAQKSYSVGSKSNSDVLRATQTYVDAQRNLAQAKYTFLLNVINLKSIAGLLQIEDVYVINNYLE